MVSLLSLCGYLTWRVVFTLPADGWNLAIALGLVSFEALPVVPMLLKVITVWNIDALAPDPVAVAPNCMRVAVLIPTYAEPAEVIAPTIAAACALEPVHETWVLDDGARGWVAEMCAAFGARYVARPTHEHAKAGNLNNALDLMRSDGRDGGQDIDIIAVLDCDHVPLPTFLTATLGWFSDDRIALVQGPQAFYNTGAFDDDGVTGEQGLFFNVQMAARHHAGAGPFWCGSTSLLRVSALREVGGVATETITEDMHTTLKLIRRGWRTVYHHQTLAVGLAPDTAEQYLLQRRRWGMGAMQILIHERLWAAKRWMSWRNFYEYLNGTVWWLEGVATVVAFLVPVTVLLTGAQTSTASPQVFAAMFAVTFALRLWGAKQLMRNQIHWPTALALRILRIPVGLACVWWLLTRQQLTFQVTPKGAAEYRHRGHTPRVIWALTGILTLLILYACGGLLRWVPWRTSAGSTVAAGVWLLISGGALLFGTRRIRADEHASTRRDAHRVPVHTTVLIDGVPAELIDISIGGAAVRFQEKAAPDLGLVQLQLPHADPIQMMMARAPTTTPGSLIASLQAIGHDWDAYRTMSLWMFCTPTGAVPGLPPGVPAVAAV